MLGIKNLKSSLHGKDDKDEDKDEDQVEGEKPKNEEEQENVEASANAKVDNDESAKDVKKEPVYEEVEEESKPSDPTTDEAGVLEFEEEQRSSKRKKDKVSSPSILSKKAETKAQRFPEIHRIQNKILDLHISENSKTFLFASPSEGCGTTTVLSQIAFSLSKEIDNKILVIDFSTKGFSLHKIFDAKVRVNLTEKFLNRASIDDLVVPTVDPNIDLFTLLMVPDCSQDDFSYDLIIDFLYKAREGYDFVLLDLPPIDARGKGGIDTPSVSRLVDGVVLVAKWRETKIKALREAKEELMDFKANILGVILNQYG